MFSFYSTVTLLALLVVVVVLKERSILHRCCWIQPSKKRSQLQPQSPSLISRRLLEEQRTTMERSATVSQASTVPPQDEDADREDSRSRPSSTLLKRMTIEASTLLLEPDGALQLVQQHQQHSQLQHLVLSGRQHFRQPAPSPQIFGFLQHLPQTLHNLELSSFNFDEDSFRPVGEWLMSQTNKKKKTTLTLRSYCELDAGATEIFQQLLQSGLHSLNLGYGIKFSRRIGTLLADAVSGARPAERPNSDMVHSQQTTQDLQHHLEEFRLDDIRLFTRTRQHEMIPFFRALATHHSRLRVLSIRNLHSLEFQALMDVLPDLIHLEHASIGNLSSCGDPHRFVRHLRRNGSLHHVGEGAESDITSIIRRHSMTAVTTYCLRNKKLPRLLATPHFLKANENAVVDEERHPSQLPSRQSAKAAAPAVRLYPKLFYAAQQCPTTGLSWILAGLLQLTCDDDSDSFGPSNRKNDASHWTVMTSR